MDPETSWSLGTHVLVAGRKKWRGALVTEKYKECVGIMYLRNSNKMLVNSILRLMIKNVH